MDLVLVEWMDAQFAHAGWEYLDGDYCAPELSRVTSVGFVVTETDDALVLAANMSTHKKITPQISGVMAIPKTCVVKRETLISSLGPVSYQASE